MVEITNDAGGTCAVSKKIKLKAAMLETTLCDYGDAFILAKKTIPFANSAVAVAAVNNSNIKVIFESCASSKME